MLITISAGTINNLQSVNNPIPAAPELRIAATQGFVANDNAIIVPYPNAYKRVTCTYDSATFILSIPEFQLESTIDGLDIQTATYRFSLWSGPGLNAVRICDLPELLNAWIDNHLNPTTLSQIIVLNNLRPSPNLSWFAILSNYTNQILTPQYLPSGDVHPNATGYIVWRTQNAVPTIYTGFNILWPIIVIVGDSNTTFPGLNQSSPGDVAGFINDNGVSRMMFSTAL